MRRAASIALVSAVFGGACGGPSAPVATEPPPRPDVADPEGTSEVDAARRETGRLLAIADFPGARGAAERWSGLEPSSPEALEALATACEGLEDLPCARDAISRALLQDPARPRLHTRLGRVHEGLGDLEAAAIEYRSVLAASPDDVRVRLSLVAVLLARVRAAREQAPEPAIPDDVDDETLGEARRLLFEDVPIEMQTDPHDATVEDLRSQLATLSPSEEGATTAGAATRRTDRQDRRAGPDVALGTTQAFRSRSSSGPQVAHRAAPTGGEPLEQAVVRRVIREHAREAGYCYERALRARPDIEGAVVVEGRIARDGSVADVGVQSTTLNDRSVHACILEAFRRWRFPAASAETPVVHPFTFRPESE